MHIGATVSCEVAVHAKTPLKMTCVGPLILVLALTVTDPQACTEGNFFKNACDKWSLL